MSQTLPKCGARDSGWRGIRTSRGRGEEGGGGGGTWGFVRRAVLSVQHGSCGVVRLGFFKGKEEEEEEGRGRGVIF